MEKNKTLIIWLAVVLVVALGLVWYFSQKSSVILSPTTSQVPAGQSMSVYPATFARPYTNNKSQQWGPLPNGENDYQAASADDNNWPKVTDVSINPLDVHVGDTQKMKIILQDTVDIKSVIAEIETDNGTTTVPLKQTGVEAVTEADYTSRPYFVRNGVLNIANDQNRQLALPDKVKPLLAQNIPPSFLNTAMAQGNVLQKFTYEGSWVVHDTIVKTYHTVFIFTDVNGRTNKTTLAWSDPCSGLPGPNCGLSCDGVLSASCTLGPGARDGVDNGNFSFGLSNFTLTLSQFATPWAGALFEWNPGKTITINNGGQILIGSGAQLSKYYLFFQDADGDTYPTQTTDSVPLTTATAAGYVRRYASKTTIDCNDANAALYQNLTGYVDSDGDGYTVGSAQQVCSGASLPSGYRATSLGTDCYDSNANAHPGQTAWFTTDRGDLSYDYNCDGLQTQQYTTVTSKCLVSIPGKTFADSLSGKITELIKGFFGENAHACLSGYVGWVTSVPACGGTGTLYPDACDCLNPQDSAVQACQ